MVTLEINLDPLCKLGSYYADQAYQAVSSVCEKADNIGFGISNIQQIASTLSFASNTSICVLGPCTSTFVLTMAAHLSLFAASIFSTLDLLIIEYANNERDWQHIKSAGINFCLGIFGLMSDSPKICMLGTLLNAAHHTGLIKVK